MKHLKYFPGALMVVFLSGLMGCQDKRNSDLPTAQIQVKDKTITVEIAATEKARSYGLMKRETLEPDKGMLFVFSSEDNRRNFYMKDTFIPLAIAFIKSDGTIMQVVEMTPRNEETITSMDPVKYALEMNEKWFDRNGVKIGDKVQFPESVRNIKAE